jgi:hypothetical protein
VRPLAERMVAIAARVTAVAVEQGEARRLASRNGSHTGQPAEDASRSEPLAELEACLAELGAIGVEVKDIDTGLLDFPALRDGEEVLLCWQVGEPTVSWWHRREDGFAGRCAIDWDGAG